jgi:hypothetical protein
MIDVYDDYEDREEFEADITPHEIEPDYEVVLAWKELDRELRDAQNAENSYERMLEGRYSKMVGDA